MGKKEQVPARAIFVVLCVVKAVVCSNPPNCLWKFVLDGNRCFVEMLLVGLSAPVIIRRVGIVSCTGFLVCVLWALLVFLCSRPWEERFLVG